VHSLIRSFGHEPKAHPIPIVSPVEPVQPAVAEVTALPVQQVNEQPTAPQAKISKDDLKEHEMMIRGDVEVKVKKKRVLPPIEPKLTKTNENVGNITWPTMDELEVPKEIKEQYEDWYKIGMNRQRQKTHGDEIPSVRNPDLIITGIHFSFIIFSILNLFGLQKLIF
jgi:hypothetical protein